mmetsp:Transcript_114590/g.180406  ORF Transcript_114590/g.180406 Transcript_114590/m.180406 type:complete len:186 (+) Transcript_114590:43-600(+)
MKTQLACYTGCFAFCSEQKRKHGEICSGLRQAATHTPDIVKAVPLTSLAQQVPVFWSRLGLHRLIWMMAKADPKVLSAVLRDLPINDLDKLVELAEKVQMDRLLSITNGGIDPSLLVHYIQKVPPASMIQMLNRVPASTILRLLEQIDANIMVELMNAVDPVVAAEFMAVVPPERASINSLTLAS